MRYRNIALFTALCLIFTVLAGGTAGVSAKEADDSSVRIIAVGDNLIHNNLIRSGKRGDKYNYKQVYANIQDYIADADVKIINQETMFVNDPAKYSGYPTFGTPTAFGEAMIAAGFNVITLATNHAYDQRMTGIKDTLAFWDQYKDRVLTTGVYADAKSASALTIGEYKGIKIAFLNYTFTSNTELPEGQTFLNYASAAKMKQDIAAARKQADFVIVLPHWGMEYKFAASPTQKTYAQNFADWGADCIIGTHPHVVEPLKLITAADGREVPCYYSLGNFVSNMLTTGYLLGAMADITLSRNEEGRVVITDYGMEPLVVHIGADDLSFSVYRLKEYTTKQIKKHIMRMTFKRDFFTVDWLKTLYDEIQLGIRVDMPSEE